MEVDRKVISKTTNETPPVEAHRLRVNLKNNRFCTQEVVFLRLLAKYLLKNIIRKRKEKIHMKSEELGKNLLYCVKVRGFDLQFSNLCAIEIYRKINLTLDGWQRVFKFYERSLITMKSLLLLPEELSRRHSEVALPPPPPSYPDLTHNL